jgi:alpha-tubulin suppressor-like RCC1 family protein
MKNCLPEVSKPLSRSVAWVWLLLSFLLIPGTQAQQVTRVGNLLTIAPSGSALANIPAEANGAIGVAATDSTSFALKPDGTVVGWGTDVNGLITDAKFIRGAKKIASGRTHAIVLLENGTLYSWGENRDNVHQFTQTIENAVDVVASFGGSGALKSDGEAVIWGNFPGVMPMRFSGVRKIEMIRGRFWDNVPIAVIYKLDGTVVFYSYKNQTGQIEANLPADVRGYTSIAAISDQYIGIRNNSTLATWVGRGESQWNSDAILTESDVNQIVTGQNTIMFLKNSGLVGSIGWLDGNGGAVSEQLSLYQNNHPSESVRFVNATIGYTQFLGVLADGTSGPIVKQVTRPVIIEEGRSLQVGPEVLLGVSYQWNKVDSTGQLQPLEPPANGQQNRLLQFSSVSSTIHSGSYVNSITGNGRTVNTEPLSVIVREVGAPNIEIDGETVYYPNVSKVRRAGSAKIRISTSITESDRVYYSLDGSEPAFWKLGQLYSGEITVTETSTLKVVVYTDEDLTRPVYSQPIEISIEPSYTINLTQVAGGKVVVTPLKVGYFAGETVRLSAYADPGYQFAGWSGVVGEQSVLDTVISGNLTVRARFEPIPSFAVSATESLVSGWTVRVAKSKDGGLISNLAKAEEVLNSNPDLLSQNETKIISQLDFLTSGSDGWPNYPASASLPGSKWEDGAVVEAIGYIEVLSPSVYTVLVRSYGTHVMSVGGRTLTGGQDVTGGWEGSNEQILRFDKPGYYPVRIVHWDNSSTKRLVVRVRKDISYDTDFSARWDNRSIAFTANLGSQQNGTPRVVADLGYSIPGVGSVVLDPPNSRYYSGSTVRLTAVPADGWQFIGWRGDSASINPVIDQAVTQNVRLTPVFGRTLSIRAVTTQGAGSIYTIPAGPVYEYNTWVTLVANPVTDLPTPSYFIQWRPNSKLGSFNFTQVKVDRFLPYSGGSILGDFGSQATLNSSQILLSTKAVGRGRITATPATGLPRNIYSKDDKVRLVAEAYADSIFDHWEVNGTSVSGSSLDLTMTASMNVVAVFQEGLHVVVADSANGKVQVVPQKAGYKVGEVVQLMAIPANGYLLDRWTDLNSRETVRSITLSGDPGYTLTVGASFVAGVQINTTVAGRGSITAVPAGPIYYPGTSVVLAPRPDYGSKFVSWSGAVQGVGDQTLTLDTTKSVQATFQNEANVPVFGSLVHWGRQDWDLAKVPAGSDFIQVSAGVNHVVALRLDGTVAAWGWANYGENVTTVPAGLTGVRQVSGGNSYSLALKQDGTVVYWGGNRWGNMPYDASQVRDGSALVSGANGALVLKSDGTVVGIGYPNGFPNVIKSWKDVVQIAGTPNTDQFYGLTRQGKVLSYHPQENNGWDKLNVPSDLNDVVQVAASERTVFAVKADGTVLAWGSDDWGLKSQANSLTGIQRIEAGLYHFLAINQSGLMTVYGESYGSVPVAAARPSQATASQQFSVAIVPVLGLSPEILGSELSSIQLEEGDELAFGLGLEGRNVSQWQWQKATESGWIDLTGQTSRRLRIASVITADAGRYRVIASNNNGSDVGPESTVVVVPSGTPLISINGSSIAGLPSDTVKVRVGDSASIRVSSRMVGGQLRYSVGGAPLSFQSPTLGNAEVVELGLGSHKFRAGVAGTTDSAMVQSLTVDLEVVPTYAISTSVGQGEGSITIIPSKTKYLKDEVVTLKATPAPGFEFAGWDGVSGTGAEISLTMNQAFSPVAKFTVRPSYRITGVDAPSLSGWKVVRVVDSSAKPVTISDLSTALDALSKTSSEVQQFSETVPTISYRGRSPGDWYEANRVFPGGSQANDSAQPKFALRATGFVNIPTPGTHSFGAVFSGPFRLRVGDNEWNSGGEAGQDGRMTEMKFGRAGLYPIELIHWDVSTDYSQIIIFSKPGTSTSYGNNIGQFVSEGARLVGDVDRGGLRVWTELPNLNVAGVGAVTGSTGYSVFAGESVTLKAEPAAGWTFVRWEGDVSGSSPTITVTPTSELRVKPVYTTPLQLSVIGDATGTVHGRLDAVPNQASYEYGALVRVDATSDAGYGFEVFGGNVTALQGKTFAPATFRVEKASPTVTARFKELAAESLISVSVNPVEGGYVQVLPAKNVFKAGDTVTLTAVPAEGYLLNAWSGAEGRSLTRTVTIAGEAGSAQTVGATFVAGVRLNTSVTGRGSISVTPSAPLYYTDTVVTATATPAYGAKFVRWEGPGEGTTTRTVTLGSTSNLKAVFENLPNVPVVGSLVYWGRNDSPVSAIPAGSDFIQVSIGNNHALALKVDGTVVAWGNANGNNNVTTVPAGLTGVVKVAAGNVQSLALKSDGTLAYWGKTDWNLYNAAAAIRDAVDIAAGESGSIILKSDGSVVGIGHADTIQWKDIVKIAAYPLQNTFLGLKKDGTVVAYNRDGNEWQNRLSIPQGLRDVVGIALSEQSAYAVKSNGTVVMWGNDWGGAKDYVKNLTGVNRVVGGWYHLLIENTAGVVTTFGDAPWNTSMPSGAASIFGLTAGQQASIGIASIQGLAPEIVGNDEAARQLEVGDELISGLGLDTRNGTSWQWQKATQEGWSDLAGQTSQRLRIASVVSSDAGRYRLVASNDNGSDSGPESALVVVPSGTPIISVNGVVVNGVPGQVAQVKVGDQATVRITTRKVGGDVRYTLDGSDPSAGSDQYVTALSLEPGSYTVRAGVVGSGTEGLLPGVTVQLSVVPTFTITTTIAQGEGTVITTPSKTRYLEGETVTLKAVADPGFEFAGWTGVDSSSAEVVLTASKNLVVGAKFAVKPTYRISGLSGPSTAGWNVVRAAIEDGSTAALESSLASALELLGKGAGEAAFYPATAPYIYYNSRSNFDPGWFDGWEFPFPGDAKPRQGKEKKAALRANGFVEIPNAGTWTFMIRNSGAYRLRVGDQENSMTGEDMWNNGRVFTTKFPKAGVYPIELVAWDTQEGSSLLMLMARVGVRKDNDEDPGSFWNNGGKFVGDVDRGGLRVWAELPDLNVAGVGAVSGSSGYGVYAGDSVTLKAEPAEGWTFVRWEGDVSGTDATISVKPEKNLNIKPVFSTALQLSAGTGGSLAAVPALPRYEYGTVVRLEASPEAGYGFQRFTGNIAAVKNGTFTPAAFVVAQANPQVRAEFTPLGTQLIGLQVNPVQGGYVQVTPAKNVFKAGDQVTLTAVPAEGYLLDAWTGADGRSLTRTMTIAGEAGSAQTVGATFVAGVRLNTSVIGRGSISVTPSAPLYYKDTVVTATATPAYGAKFVRWEGTGEGITARTVTLGSTSDLRAVFENMPDVPVAGSLVHWGKAEWGVEKVPGGSDFVQISAGVNHVVALRVDGTVVSWGWANGGDNVTTVPAGLTDVRQVSGGNGYSLALKTDGTVVHWGGNRWGNMPADASQVRDGITVVSGQNGAVVLKGDGTVVGLGHANTIQEKGWKDIVQIAGNPNQDQFFGLTRRGTVLAYHRDNWNGADKLTVPADLKDVVQIASSQENVFAVKADGTVVAWNGDWWNLKTQANSLKGIRRIEAGQSHILVLDQNGVWTAYGNTWGGVPPTASKASQATASQEFSVAIIPVSGLAPEIVGTERGAVQLEVDDELLLGLGLEGKLATGWQWQKATQSGWSDVTGQTSRRLRIASVASTDAGRFRVVASNDNGSDYGPETTVVVVPSGTPLISVNGTSIAGLPGDTVKLRVGDAAAVRVSSRMVDGQVRYSLGAAPANFSSTALGVAEAVEFGLGTHKFRAGVARNTDTVMVQSLTLELEVVPTYAVSSSVGQGEGSITITPSKPKYLEDEVVTVKAVPAPGFEFAGWEGVSGTTAEITLTMNQAFSPVAKFAVRPSYRITGVEAPSQSGWKVVRVVDGTKPVTITGDISTALDALAKTSAEAQFYSEVAPFISYRGKMPSDNWPEANRVFPGGSQANDSEQPKYAMRASGFVEIPTPGTYTFGAMFSGPFRLRVGDNEWLGGWDTWRDGRVNEFKFARAGFYAIELIQWDENPSTSQILLFARAGAGASYANDLGRFYSEGARFVGDVDRGGLRVWTELPNLNVAGVGTVTGSTGYSVFAGESVTLKAEPVSGWTFARWEGDVSGTSSTVTVTPTSDLRVKPVYTTSLQLMVIGDDATSAVHGRLTAVPNQTAYEYGTVVRLDAAADAGYGFQVFGGNVAALQGKTFAPATFRVDKATPTVNARFKELAADSLISVSVNPVQGGYVQVTPAKNVFKAGDQVTLTAVPAEGYLLDGWTGAEGRSLTRTMTIAGEAGSAQTVGATFVAGVRLNTSVTGRGSISVTPSAPLYYKDTVVTAMATPAYGARFVRWEGAGEGATSRTVTLNATSNLKAVFENLPDVPVAGSLVYWGRNDSPIAAIPTGSDFVQVSIGNNHALALKVDGTVVAWGNANGNNNVTTVPAGLTGVTKVAAGNVQSLALKSDGTVAYWGRSDWNIYSSAAAIRDAVDIAAGESGSIILKSDGSVVGIGHADTIQWRNVVKIASYPTINLFLGLRNDGQILAYHRDQNDWVGRLPSSTNSSVFNSKDNVSIALSENTAYAVKRDGSVVAWGNDWGGIKDYVKNLNGVNRIVGGWYHILIENTAGVVTTFGDAPWGTPMPPGSAGSFSLTAGQQASIGIVPISGLAPEIVGSEPSSRQLEVGDELVLGLGLETQNGSRWQWQKASGSGANVTWSAVAGQTSRRLRIASVASADAGRYRLVASNDMGSDVGPEISVAVVPSGTPQIVVNGVPVNGMPGEVVRLKVGDRAKVTLSTRLEGASMYYSTEGEDPTIASFEYTPTTDIDLGLGTYTVKAGADSGSGNLVKSLVLELEVVPTFSVTSQISAGEGVVELRPAKTRYLQGDVISAAAKAAPGFEFAGWEGVSGSGATTEVIVTKDLSIGARFRTLPIFRISGTEVPNQPGWKVTRLVSSGNGTNGMTASLESAAGAFSLPSSSVQAFSETVPYVNYRGRNPGNWLQENRVYPGGSQAETSTQVPFVVKASGYIEIPEPGSWTFGVVFSGPFRLKVGDSEWQGGWETWQDGRMSVLKFPKAGVYPIEILQWDQNPNEASLLLFARKGGLPGYDSDVGRFYNEGARFVGDVERGGLRVWSELPGLDVAGVGKVTGATGYSVTAGQSVQLKAEPAAGWTFVRWSGDVTGTDPVVSLTPTSDLEVKPIFATTVALSVPAGNGTLTATPAATLYEYGSKVRLTATPDAGYGFQRFNVNISGLTGLTLSPTEIAVTKPAIQVSASFVSLTASTPGFVALDLGTPVGGLVTVTPAKNLFNPGASVTAKAVADPGWFFTGWESPLVSTQQQIQFFLPNQAGSVTTVRPQFIEGVALATQVTGRGRVVSNPPDSIHFPGSTVRLKAEPASGARFVRWESAVTLDTPTSPELSLVMSAARQVTAVFENDLNSREFGRLVGNGTSLAQSQALPAGDDFVQVSLGAFHALALRLNGSVEAWGDNRFGQVAVPVGLSGVRSVVAGANYSLALKDDGSVVGWGQGIAGINLGILPRDITSMVAGATHVVFLRSNGLALPIKLRGGGLGAVPLTPAIITPEMGYPLSVVDPAERGFNVRMFQASQSNGWLPNGNARAEAQIAGVLTNAATGKLYENIIDTAKTSFEADGSYWEKKSIYYNQDFSGDRQFPGIPGKEGHTDNMAMEVVTWLELAAGRYSMVVNSDDSFRVSVGRDLAEKESWPYLGEFNAGRGAADTEFSFEVAQGGVYGFRLVYDEGMGGANCYWYVSQAPGLTNRVYSLVNEDSDSLKPSIKAYRKINAPAVSTIKAESVSQVAANINTSSLLFLRRDGSVVGYPETDHLGQTTIPSGINDFIQVALSRSAAFGLRSNGKVVVWGTIDPQVKSTIEALSNVTSLTASGTQIWLYDGNGQSVSFMDDGNQPSRLLVADGTRIKSPQFLGVTALGVAPYSGFAPYVGGFNPADLAVEAGGRLFLGTALVPESGATLTWEFAADASGPWSPVSADSLSPSGLPVFDPITPAASGYYRWTARNGAGVLVGTPIRVVSRPAGSPVLLVNDVPYEQAGSSGARVFGGASIAVRSSAGNQLWKINLGGGREPISLKSGEVHALGLGTYQISAEATVAGVDLKSVELPVTVVPLFQVSAVGNLGGGSVQVEVAESDYTVPQSGGYQVAAGATIRALATPGYGYRIKAWKGFAGETSSVLTFTVDGDRQVEAEFEAIPAYNLTLVDGVDRGGSIVGVQPTLSQLNAVGNRLLQGTSVTLRADPRPGFVFKAWKLTGQNVAQPMENPLTLVMDSSVSVEAVFETTISIQGGLVGGAIQTDLSGATVSAGQTGYFYAVPEAGRHLGNWSIQEVAQNQIQVSQSFGYGGDDNRPQVPVRFERASYRDAFQWAYSDLPEGSTNISPAMTVELSGVFYPPANSFYQFKVQSEGFAELWISPDAKAENLVRVAADGDNFPLAGMSTVASDISGLSTISPKLSLKSGQGYFLRVRLFKAVGQSGSVALTLGSSVLGDSMDWETDPMSASNFRLPPTGTGPVLRGSTAVLVADRPYQVSAVFKELPTDWTSLRAVDSAGVSVNLTPSVALVGLGQTVKAAVDVKSGFHFDRWLRPLGLPEADVIRSSIEVVAGNEPLVFEPRIVPETALVSVRSGQNANQTLEEGQSYSLILDRLQTDSRVEIQVVEGPTALRVVENADKSFGVSWITTEADGPSNPKVQLRAMLRSENGDVLGIQVIEFRVEVQEVNLAPELVGSASPTEPIVVAAGSILEVPFEADDSDLPVQILEALVVDGPSGGQIQLSQDGLHKGGKLAFRWLASEGLGDRIERVTLAIRDPKGLQSTRSFLVKVPAVAPNLTVVSPESGSITDERITVSGSASDNSGVVSVKLLRDGVFAANMLLAGGVYTYRVADRLTNSTTRFAVVATDASGNSTTIERTIEWTPLRRPILGTLGTIKDGQELVVPLGLETPGDVSGMAFALTYDPTYLKSPQVSFKDSLPGAVVLANVDKPGEIRITLSSASGKTLPGGVADLAEIRFRARSVPETVRTQIRAAIEDTSDARGKAHAFGNGNAAAQVEIQRRTYVGDNNGNDLIDVGDAYLIQRKLVRLDPTEPWDVVQNDLNASDSIDSGDVTSVLRIVVDLDPIQTLAGPSTSPGSGPAAVLARSVVSGTLGGSSVEKRSSGFRIASGSAQAKARAGVVTLRHPASWVISEKSVTILGQNSGGALISAATHVRDSRAYTRISYLMSQAAGTDGITLEVQPERGIEFGGSVSLQQWSFSKNGFDLANAVVEPTEVDFPVIPTLVESIGLVRQASGLYLNIRGIPNVDYSIQTSTDLVRWQEIERHTASGDLELIPVKSDGSEGVFYRSVRVVGGQGITNK